MTLGRAANIRAGIPALCAGLVAMALAALLLGVAGAAAASPAKQSAAAIKKAKKRAVKKTTKGVHKEVTSSSTPGLAQPDQGPQVKVSSCKQLRVHHRLSGFKCSWSAQGELPGIVPFRCAGKAKLKANGRKLKRLDGCDNNLEAQAPLLADHHPVAFGYYEDWTAHPGLFDELAEGGAGIARVDLDWRTLQPTQNAAPANWDWGPTDAIYNSMLAVGVRPVFTFIDAPCWAAAGTCGGSVNPPAQDHLADYGAAAAQIALRYPQAAGIEIWLEPNNTPFWGAAPDPGRYADLVRATTSAVRATGSSMPLITGGLAPGAAASTKLEFGEFLAQALAHGGIETADAIGFDAVTDTPFTSPDDPTAGYLGRLRVQIQELHAKLASAGAQRPIAILELAYSTSGDGAYSEDQQSQALSASLGVLRRIADVPLAIVSRLYDNGDGSKVEGFGVLHQNGSPKTAYCRLASDAGVAKPQGC